MRQRRRDRNEKRRTKICSPLWQLLQIGASFLTSFFIDIYDTVLPTAQSMAVRLVLLAAAIVITSMGIILTVGMEIVPNPVCQKIVDASRKA